MEDYKDINAAWANKIATTQLGELAQKQLSDILKTIKEAASKNKFSVTAMSIEDINDKELRNRGFKIKYNEGDPRDQREHGYYTISW